MLLQLRLISHSKKNYFLRRFFASLEPLSKPFLLFPCLVVFFCPTLLLASKENLVIWKVFFLFFSVLVEPPARPYRYQGEKGRHQLRQG